MGLPKYKITCVFEEGATKRFEATAIDTVYTAALRSGLMLETDCREGACGACKAHCNDGKGDIGDISDEALTPEEEEEGFVLTCQFRPQSDLVLEFGYPLSLLNKEVTTVSAKVEALEPVAEAVMRLQLSTKDAPPAFLPGQYMNIIIPGTGEARSYSFANPTTEPGAMEFFVRLLEQGAMSNYLRDRAAVGNEIQLRGPYGQFFLRKPRAGYVLMIAGGTGLAPMLSMLEELAQLDERPQVTVLYGANQPGELFGRERIEAYGDWVQLHRIVVAGDDDWDGATGFVTDLLNEDTLPDAAATDAYLCGPPPMIEAAQKALTERGVPDERVFAEKFLPSGT